MTHRPAAGPAPRLVPITIEGPAGPLEALLQEHDEHDHTLTAVVCHPHPLYGGTMHNKVAHRVASTLHELGAAVVRFNFRGVGKSAGQHDRGRGETEDARAALRFLRQRYPAARRWVAGFSFGSGVAARLAASEPEIERLILVAPPVASVNFDILKSLSTPKLVLQGTADTTCPPERLYAQFPTWSPPRELIEIPNATHFFDKQLGALAHALEQALGGRSAA